MISEEKLERMILISWQSYLDRTGGIEISYDRDLAVEFYKNGYRQAEADAAELVAALEKCKRANERRPEDGKGGPDFSLSRVDIAAIADQALSNGRERVV